MPLPPSPLLLPRQTRHDGAILGANVLKCLTEKPAQPVHIPLAADEIAEVQLVVNPVRAVSAEAPDDRPLGLAEFFLSHLEKQIMTAILAAPGRVAKGGAIGRSIKCYDRARNAPTTKAQILLTNLFDKGVLLNTDDGYRVSPEFEPLLCELPADDISTASSST